jgi:hypothetical protein
LWAFASHQNIYNNLKNIILTKSQPYLETLLPNFSYPKKA